MALRGIPGVGTRTAERILVELRGRITDLEAADAGPMAAGDEEAALSALLNLGYPRNHAEKAVRTARERLPNAPKLEDWIREALRVAAR